MILGIVGNCRVDPKRLFTRDDKARLLSEKTPDENGLYECEDCHQHFHAEELTVDHKRLWNLGGRTEPSNAQLLCRFLIVEKVITKSRNQYEKSNYSLFNALPCCSNSY